ncbi:MAG TPA: hypothetical protein VMW69_09110 [Spirochaetia bacterium]|nr:hypothetical protein [Spirochaetia bacterium]
MGNDDEVKGGSAGPKARGSRPTRSTGRTSGAGVGKSNAVEDSNSKELAIRSRNMFLRDVEHQLARRELYNLDEEFAKTKKNRSPVVILSVGLFVVIMLAAGIAVTTYIQQRSQNVPVNISSFQDVNLMELLDRAKQLNDQQTAAQRDLQTLEASQSDEINAVRSNESHQVQLVNNELISAGEKQTKIATIRAQAEYQVRQIEAKYADPITKKKAEITSLQNQAAQYDTRQMQQAKKQEAILNNQQKLFDLQMQKTVDYYKKQIADTNSQYESQIASIDQHNTQLITLMKQNQATEIAQLIAKYNPTFSSPELAALISQPIPADPVSSVTEDPFVRMVVQAGVVNATSISDLQNRMNNFAALIGALQKVPYENSVPPALAHLRYFNNQIVNGYRSIGQGLTEIVGQKNQQIQQLQQKLAQADGIISTKDSTIAEYTQALSSLVRNSRENGYVLDARDPSKIAVFVDPLYHVTNGDTAYVFRRDDQQIGTIRFSVSDGTITAQQLSLDKKDTPMQPFDKILLNLK